MTDTEISLAGFLLLFVFISLIGHAAAYRNGCTDGYGYSKEPTCPGYKKAGEYLQKYMSHRWPELIGCDFYLDLKIKLSTKAIELKDDGQWETADLIREARNAIERITHT